MISYPDSIALPLARPISDHLPCLIKVGTSIPKAKVFRFENFWLEHNDFKDVVQRIWNQNVNEQDSTERITKKFKKLGKGLKIWFKIFSNLAATIKACNEVILCLI